MSHSNCIQVAIDGSFEDRVQQIWPQSEECNSNVEEIMNLTGAIALLGTSMVMATEQEELDSQLFLIELALTRIRTLEEDSND